jgi:hypothetical protein
MMWLWQFDVKQLADVHLHKPWKVIKGKKQFSIADEKPKAVPGDIRDLNFRSALSTRHGFHFHAPEAIAAR